MIRICFLENGQGSFGPPEENGVYRYRGEARGKSAGKELPERLGTIVWSARAKTPPFHPAAHADGYTVAFSRHSRMAALLLAPYLLWTGFALLLNF
ncbi:MAG TPA: tryptophan-rich sensory protein [Candidatus Sulfotelmatobacter sp.]|nr:tryptophan-rich sensory protein [Candidatus Sulfotelmatobacter sp.]